MKCFSLGWFRFIECSSSQMRQRDKSTADLFQRQLLKSENRNQKSEKENRNQKSEKENGNHKQKNKTENRKDKSTADLFQSQFLKFFPCFFCRLSQFFFCISHPLGTVQASLTSKLKSFFKLFQFWYVLVKLSLNSKFKNFFKLFQSWYWESCFLWF